MKNENCIFCKIAAGEIPSATIYEDDDFRVILDIEPASKGHALILPKEHYANLYELPEELASKEVAGQTVFHFHMHLIPRYKDDDVTIGWKPGKLTDVLKEQILSKMK